MLIINPIDRIEGCIEVPGDKSISHRAVMLGSIAQGKTLIKNFLMGEDCLSTIQCFQKMGVSIEVKGKEVHIQGKGPKGLQEPETVLDAGNSGTTMRLMAGILAGQDFVSVVTGDDSLRKRPMGRIIQPLQAMGAIILGRQMGKLAPLTIRGGYLKGIQYTMPVSSAQVKSAILLAGLFAQGVTQVQEKNPSRDHTEKMIRAFGGKLEAEGGIIRVQSSVLYGQEVQVPGDISSAAFFMVAAAAKKNSRIKIKNLGLNPTRTGIIDVLRAMGAEITLENLRSSGGEPLGDVIIEGRGLTGTTIGKEMLPRLVDEIPVIAVAAALAEGKTLITGAEELRIKESDRIAAMVSELSKLGINIKELPDGMEIEGPNVIQGGEVNSYGDHRIAMALAIAGLFAQGAVKIKNPQCIAISYPDFEATLKSIGR